MRTDQYVANLRTQGTVFTIVDGGFRWEHRPGLTQDQEREIIRRRRAILALLRVEAEADVTPAYPLARPPDPAQRCDHGHRQWRMLRNGSGWACFACHPAACR